MSGSIFGFRVFGMGANGGVDVGIGGGFKGKVACGFGFKIMEPIDMIAGLSSSTWSVSSLLGFAFCTGGALGRRAAACGG